MVDGRFLQTPRVGELALRGMIFALLAAIMPLPARAQVVINELQYHPAGDAAGEEFIELFNTGSQAVDLSGWFFSDGVDFVFPVETALGAGEYLVVSPDPAATLARYG
ncbi:MAG: lamin tail domain-containing protein, partial [bacterium]